MHEIERMIRLLLEPGPQLGSDVRRWVADASGYHQTRIRQVAAEMVVRGDLVKGAWALSVAPTHSIRENLYGSLPPSPKVMALPEIIEREWRLLMGAEE